MKCFDCILRLWREFQSGLKFGPRKKFHSIYNDSDRCLLSFPSEIGMSEEQEYMLLCSKFSLSLDVSCVF